MGSRKVLIMATIVPDRSNDPKRVPGKYMDLVNKATVFKGENPKWNCDACGKKGASDYMPGGRMCNACADIRGF